METKEKLTLARRIVGRLAELPIETQRDIMAISAMTAQEHATVLGKVLRVLRDVGGQDRLDVVRTVCASLGEGERATSDAGD